MFPVRCLSLALLAISAVLAQSTANQSATPPISTSSARPASSVQPSTSGTPAPAPAAASSVPSVTIAPASDITNPIGEAKVLYRKGDFTGAIATYQEFLKEHPNSPDALAGKVQVYLKQKDIERAAQAVKEGLARSDSPRMRAAQAEVWFRQGKISDAEKQWAE